MPSCAALLTLALVALSGCRCNPQYCEGHIGNNCDLPASAIDGQQGCISNDQCSGSTSVCNVSAAVCVQCTTDQPGACTGATPVCGATNTCVECTGAQLAACTGATPICNADSNKCERCTAHAQCTGSAVCLPDGSCANQTDVAYVAPQPVGSDNASCTKTTPCVNMNKALQTSRRYVKLSGTTDEVGQTVSINNQDVTLLADPGAQLTSTSNGLLLEIRGTSHVAIYDLEITGASGATGIGISVPTGSGGSLTISRSTISNNQGGGISVMGGTFVIVGNVFFNNGADSTLIGGVAIGSMQNATNRLEFNSFLRNKIQNGLGSAIQCVAGTFTARNNIMSDNGTISNSEQVGGTCMHSYSIVRPGTLPTASTIPAGANNIATDPEFVDTVNGDLHIKPGSPARHAADPSSDLTGITSEDIDGDSRVAPADIGADQVK